LPSIGAIEWSVSSEGGMVVGLANSMKSDGN